MHLKGFRPGKAPVAYLKKTYGKRMMSEIVEEAVSKSSQQAVKDNKLKPAFPPRVDLVGELQQVVDGNADLEFTVKVDLMPEFELADVSKLKVERLISEVTDAEVEDAVTRLAEQPVPILCGEGERAQRAISASDRFHWPIRWGGIRRRKGRRLQPHSRLGPAYPRFRRSDHRRESW